MGHFTRKPRPAYTPPELPLSHNPDHRRASVLDRIRNFNVADPSSSTSDGDSYIHGAQQNTFLGRKFSEALVPAFARKASLAVAERKRDPTGLRLGETDVTVEEEFKETFNARLELDGSDTEVDEKFVGIIQGTEGFTGLKGKAREKNWAVSLGWDAPPKGVAAKRGKEREKMKWKHKKKRVMRGLDADLDAFNTYAQNGLTPLTRSLNGSSVSLAEEESVFEDDRPKAVLNGDGFDALDVMADHIFRIGVQKKKWFQAPRMGQKREKLGRG